MYRCAVLVFLLIVPLAIQAQDVKSPSLEERIRLLEDAARNERHNHDEVLKQIDDLQWYEKLGDVAQVAKIRYTSAPGYQANPKAQGAGNPLVIHAYTFLPKQIDRSKKYPLLVFPHGGVHSNFSTHYALPVRELVEQGYAIIAPDFRGSTGYGAAFYNQIDYGGKEIDDVYAAGQWMLAHYDFLDKTRVGIFGWSHGGFLTLWNIFRYSETYVAAFAGMPVSNLALRAGTKAKGAKGYPIDDYGAPSSIGAPAFDNVAEYVRRSPAYNADKLQTPLLIHSASNDSDVNVFEVQQLVDSLRARGKKFEYKEFDNPPGEHGFELLDTDLARQARLEVYRFLARYLHPAKPVQ